MEIHIGVIPLPEPEYNKKTRVTTYDVATILEEKYGLFSFFVSDNIDTIASLITKNIQTSLHRHIQGESEDTATLDTAPSEMLGMLKRSLDSQAFDGRIAKVPTKAALKGFHRLKKPEERYGPPRPSFEDTTTMYQSLRVWAED